MLSLAGWLINGWQWEGKLGMNPGSKSHRIDRATHNNIGEMAILIFFIFPGGPYYLKGGMLRIESGDALIIEKKKGQF